MSCRAFLLIAEGKSELLINCAAFLLQKMVLVVCICPDQKLVAFGALEIGIALHRVGAQVKA